MPVYDYRENEIRALIGNHSVSAQGNIGVHFSQREQIYRFPNKLAESDYVILWLNNSTKNSIEFYVQMHPDDYLKRIENLLVDKHFKIVYWDAPWLVFKREVKTKDDIRDTQVFARMKALGKLEPNY